MRVHSAHEPESRHPSPCPLSARRGEGGRRPGESPFTKREPNVAYPSGLSGREFVDRPAFECLAGAQHDGREVRLVDRVGEMLSLQTEAAVPGINRATNT